MVDANFRPSPLRRVAIPIAIAVGSVLVAALLRLWPLGVLGERTAWLTFYPAVMVAALSGGWISGLGATALSIAVVAWMPLPFFGAVVLRVSADWIGASVFLFNGLAVSLITGAMRHSRATLARQNQALAQARDQAQAADQAKSRFLASVSHELRTPLNAILGFSDHLVRQPTLSEPQREQARIIHTSGTHLLALINDVLDIARIEAGRQPLQLTPMSLAAVFDESVTMLRLHAEGKGVGLRSVVAPGLPIFMLGDALRMRQVLVNLLGNALQATPYGTVTLHADEAPTVDGVRQVHLRISDTGRGIPEADLKRIFEPFVQLDPSAGHGSGLGLAVTREIVGLLGGRIWAESQLGIGSTFHVVLPMPIAESTAEAVAQSPAGVRRRAGRGTIHLLIADDVPDNVALLRTMLDMPGHDISVAVDGLEAVRLARSMRPQVVFMDVRMPGIDGLEAVRRIRAEEWGRTMPIVVLTASVFAEQLAAVRLAGADEALPKPYRVEDIHQCLCRLLPEDYEPVMHHDSGSTVAMSVISPTDLRMLSVTERAALHQAVLVQDRERIQALIDSARQHTPELAARLANHAERLEYSAIMRALASVQEGSP
ncbi:MAG TPA: hypothetical protein DCS97_15665 [Planctomycetes bacterium]|nr:hypothetical protein [Planctomycetota bacterium]